jgi:hypothetical protein
MNILVLGSPQTFSAKVLVLESPEALFLAWRPIVLIKSQLGIINRQILFIFQSFRAKRILRFLVAYLSIPIYIIKKFVRININNQGKGEIILLSARGFIYFPNYFCFFPTIIIFSPISSSIFVAKYLNNSSRRIRIATDLVDSFFSRRIRPRKQGY